MRSPLLDDALPTEVILGGRAYKIAHDYRNCIRFETLMADDDVPDRAKRSLAIRMFFGRMPLADLGEVIAAIIDFYRCGKPTADIDSDGRPLYSFVHDYDLIFAGFLQSYGVDLLDKRTRIHWYRFRAMLMALPESGQFMRVLGYRAAKITSDMPKEMRDHLRQMKMVYALPEVEVTHRIGSEDELQRILAEIAEEKARA